MMIFFYFLLYLSKFGRADFTCDPVPGTPTVTPMGKAFGVKPGRVTWYFHRDACSWNGKKLEFWWDPKFLNQTDVDSMLSRSLLSLTDTKTEEDAWTSLFKDFNSRKHGTPSPYVKGEKIAIKMNLNEDAVVYIPYYPSNSVSPQFIKSLARQLVNKGGVNEEDITFFDASRIVQSQFWDEPTGLGKEFPKIGFVDNKGGREYVKKAVPDTSTKFFFSNQDVASWNTTLLPKCLTEAKYVIEVNAFRGHSVAGITESGKNWFGSIYRPDITCIFLTGDQHWCPASLHKWVNITGVEVPMGGGWLPQRPMGVYNPLVDLLGHDDTANKGLLFFSDGTYGGLSQATTSLPLKFQMKPFNNHWSCSIFASQDSMALDSTLFDFLRSEKTQEFPNKGCTDNYLHEGSQANNPPSGTNYAPSGKTLESLGVHEHWNNADDKQYSRNLGVGDGIELVKVHELY